MPKCPNCKDEITYLNAYSEVVSTFELDKEGKPSCSGMDYCEGYTGFECPECCEKICNTEQEATTLLENDKLKQLVKDKLNKINDKQKEDTGDKGKDT